MLFLTCNIGVLESCGVTIKANGPLKRTNGYHARRRRLERAESSFSCGYDDSRDGA